MAARKKPQGIDALRAAVRQAADEPHGAESIALLRKALTHKNWLVVAETAAIVGKQRISGCDGLLAGVWDRFLGDGSKLDPGCRAKEAALTALDELDTMDPDPFLRAIRHRQVEPVYGGRTDTAGGVRQRALSALLRMHYSDAMLHAGELMADPEAPVRAGVVRALGHLGARDAAALLLYKLHEGDDDPVVIGEAAAALLAVAPDVGLRLLGAWLTDDDDLHRESAALALGQSGVEGHVARLLEWIDDGLMDRDFDLAVRALGLSRSERARNALLDIVAHGATARAEQALHALAIHSYDSQLAERVLTAVSEQDSPHLRRLAERSFGENR